MKLRPLGDKVILQYQETEEKTQSGIILPDSAKEKPQEAVVAAVGDGKGYEGKDVQMQVKEGDHVIFSKYKKCICFHTFEENGGTGLYP